MRVALSWGLAAALLVHAAAHVAIVIALARGAPRWRALAAFLVPPLAPYWAFVEQRRALAWTWLGALAAYAAGVVLA